MRLNMIKKNYQSEYEKLAKENQAFLKYQYQDLILFFLKKIRDFPDLPQNILYEDYVNILEEELKLL